MTTMNMPANIAALAVGALLLAGSATAQMAVLQNGGFETVNPVDPSLPLGWGPFNGAQRRTVGDGLTPTLTSAHSGIAAIEMTPRQVGPSDFIGMTTDAL